MTSPLITGIGAVTALGKTAQATWEGLCRGADGLSEITLFPTDTLRNSQGGQIAGLEPPEGETRIAFFLKTAVREALTDALLGDAPDACRNTALVIGTNFGNSGKFSAYQRSCRDGSPDPALAQEYQFDVLGQDLAREFALGGTVTIISLACASGIGIVDTGMLLLEDFPRVVCAAADELTLYTYAGLNALRAITKDRIRPFDQNRAGTQFAEGAGAIILERAHDAHERNVSGRAEVKGVFVNNDAYHATAPDKEGNGIAAVMKKALAKSDLKPEAIHYLNAHGTGTKYNDAIETRAVKQVFNEHASTLKIDALKSMLGHAMGAAGILEIISTVYSLEQGLIPPTMHCENPDPELDLHYCFDTAVKADINYAMSNSYGIGGANGSVVLAKVTQ